MTDRKKKDKMSEKLIGVYKITNIINGDCYVGKSIDIKKRWVTHKSIHNNKNSKAYNYYLYRAMRFYKIENFSFEILELCAPSLLAVREKHYYDLYIPKYCLIDPLENPTQFISLNKEIFIEKCRAGWINRSEKSKNKTLKNLKKGCNSKNSGRFPPKRIVSIKILNNEEQIFKSLLEAEKTLGIPRSSISQILDINHSRTKAKGYTFRFF